MVAAAKKSSRACGAAVTWYPFWSCGDAPEDPPEGFVYAPCPPLATPEDYAITSSAARCSSRAPAAVTVSQPS